MNETTPDASKARILIVEDENLVAMDIERGLKRLGYNVVGVANCGADAIQIAEDQCPDLILMDIQIKGDIDGIETSQRIQNKYSVPIVFLTAHADEATLHRAKRAGPFGYVLKPFEETELHTAIQIAMQKHRVMLEQQRYAKLELEQSEEKFKILVNSVRDYAVCILDTEGNISSWNWGAQRIYGYTQEEISGRHFSTFFVEDATLSGAPQWELDQTSTSGFTEDEGWKVRKDGTKFWAQVNLTRMTNANNTPIGYAMVTRDLTERKRAEDRIRLVNESLEKRIQDRTVKLTEALQIRDEFLSIAAHELKNPLSTMCLQLTLLHRHVDEFMDKKPGLLESNHAPDIAAVGRLTKAVISCEKQSKRILNLIDQLLDLTRIRIGKIELQKEDVDLGKTVKEIVDRQKTDHTNIPAIDFIDSPQNIVGKWDRSRLEQVIINLLSNAIKYGEEKPIEIAVDCDFETEVAHIRITDHGIGIPLDMQESIFNKFQRSAEVRNITGLGLGLYIVRKITEAHGGHIYVQSRPKAGSTFIVELPLDLPHKTPTVSEMQA